PFTTLVPNLGMVAYRSGKSFVMADIPGIIEGAAEGKGLGLRFLRHIERNAVLLFMCSLSEEKPIADQYDILLKELERYNPELLDKQRVLAVTKCDLLSPAARKKTETELRKQLPDNLPFVLISSVAGTGIDMLKDMLWKALSE
ncbi:MAG: 50S ribosome-binding GTPase, partial [Bacteroidales bacterium]|nr:50S ribosome-binding GTPase [Bacteroidales bacterium]